MASVAGPGHRLLNRLLLRPALAMRLRIQQAIEEAGFDDFRISHMNVFAWLPDSGARIGQLARQAQLSKQTMTELVSELTGKRDGAPHHSYQNCLCPFGHPALIHH